MGNLVDRPVLRREKIWRDISTKVFENPHHATHTKEYHPQKTKVPMSFDILLPSSLVLLQSMMREKALLGYWLVISERGELKIKLENFYISVEFVTSDEISYAVSHRWGEEVIKVDNSDFAVDWVGQIPNGRAWIDCVTHMNDPLLVKRTLERMGEVYVRSKVHAIYCLGGNKDVMECVFRGWMFQELSYISIKEASKDWTTVGLGAWALRMIGCLDQYDMHDLLVMTKSTSNPNLLASSVGACIRNFYAGGISGRKDPMSQIVNKGSFRVNFSAVSEFRKWVGDLPEDPTSVNIEDFKKHLSLNSPEPFSSIGAGARLTEYMCIKLVSLFQPFLGDGELKPVSSGRYIDTLLNNLNMAVYSKERDALIATMSSYHEYLCCQDDYKIAIKCAQFIEEEEYFIIEPKRHDTTLLLLEALSLLIETKRYCYDRGLSEITADGVISWLSTQHLITIYYTGNRLSCWKRIDGDLDWSTIPNSKASMSPLKEIVMSENPEIGYFYAGSTT
jgi:hypothetical protein